MNTLNKQFQALKDMDPEDQPYYRNRFKEAVEARIIAKIGNGKIHGLHHFSPQTIKIQVNNVDWYLQALILDVDHLIYSIHRLAPTISQTEAFLRGENIIRSFSLVEQLSIYQQLACNEWIDFPKTWKVATGIRDNLQEARVENAKKSEETKKEYAALFYHGFEARFEAEWGDGILPGLHDFTERTVKIFDHKERAYYFSMLSGLWTYILPEANLRADGKYTKNPSLDIEDNFSLDERLSLFQQLISHPFITPPQGFTV